MILRKDLLTKSLKKGRLQAVGLLQKLAHVGGIPEPVYQYEPGGSTKRRTHFYKVRFQIPQVLQDHRQGFYNHVVGAGRDTRKKDAKSLAALEAVHRLEEELGVKRGGMDALLEQMEQKQQEHQQEIDETPVEKMVESVSWACLPIDANFGDFSPASRQGRINFIDGVLKNSDALVAAKGLTLLSQTGLPAVENHANQTDDKGIQHWVNIRLHAPGGKRGKGRVIKSGATRHEENYGIDAYEAQILALQRMGEKAKDKDSFHGINKQYLRNDSSSFGMAKLFTELPPHHFKDLKELLDNVKVRDKEEEENKTKSTTTTSTHRHRSNKTTALPCKDELTKQLQNRLNCFRQHQKRLSLPVDSVEDQIPFDAPVTIVRGGTGSGKTTRYPLMLSLSSPQEKGPPTRVLVAQPRRLACQTAARRVAEEQNEKIGQSIGYSIRFESFPSTAPTRTVDFQTPGVILRTAMNDPLLQHVTHLVLDEIHERNADMDLVLALAKECIKQRAEHPTLPPLKLVLMSATLDTGHWVEYFSDLLEPRSGSNSANLVTVVVDVPDRRRYPIDIVHLGEDGFPSHVKEAQRLLKFKHGDGYALDEMLCEATAELAVHVFNKELDADGSILCFLPGIQEIRDVDRMIRNNFRRGRSPTVVYLHSSLSSQEQRRAFQPGPKIILSTNIAETSVTIPDIKVVIDSGRERQFSMLEGSSMEDISVVGSQLATVTISQASAKQRAGRAGRVSAGTCYRLYSRQDHDKRFQAFTQPEMLRMDLSSLVLHSLSAYRHGSQESVHLLLNTPDPPSMSRLQQTLKTLEYQGLLVRNPEYPEEASLTPLGRIVSTLPASPRIGRMLFMGLALGAIDPALEIAALLSVPKAFSQRNELDSISDHSSDIVMVLEEYQRYNSDDNKDRKDWPRKVQAQFNQVSRVKRQLESALTSFLRLQKAGDLTEWNLNSHRIGAVAGIVCAATPHIAHLVSGRNGLATRDVAGTAKIHPSSINAAPSKRAHWYLYHELRTTSQPFLHLTTAASPLELALFSEASDIDFSSGDMDDWLYIADQWVPVEISAPNQRPSFIKLRRLLTDTMLQELAVDPASVKNNHTYQRIVVYTIAAIEHQRLPKLSSIF